MFNVLETMNVKEYAAFFKKGMKVKTNPNLLIFDDVKTHRINEGTILEVIDSTSSIDLESYLSENKELDCPFISKEWQVVNHNISITVRLDEVGKDCDLLPVPIGDFFTVSNVIIRQKDIGHWRWLEKYLVRDMPLDDDRKKAIASSDSLIGQLHLVPINESDYLNRISSPSGIHIPLI